MWCTRRITFDTGAGINSCLDDEENQMETHAALVDITHVDCHANALGSYHAELTSDLLDEQGQLLDEVIAFAFETLGVRHLDVRVVPAEHRRAK
jgi:hypothetical protein